MAHQILSIVSLLLGSVFLVFAGGINSLILPIRGAAEHFTAFELGLLGTGWAIGYVLGCMMTPRLVARVGHVRAFSVMASLAGASLLVSLLWIWPPAWILMRSVVGFCFAGAAMIVESWLNERADASNRGRIFAIYTMVNLFATTAGQMVVGFGPVHDHFFFVVGAIFYAIAVLPLAVSSSQSPKPLVQTRLDLAALWRNSPVAVVSCFLIGISNSAFGALAAVYAAGLGLPVTIVAAFASVPILTAAVAQIPVGVLSDRMDRRVVLVLVALSAIGADAMFSLVQPTEVVRLLALSAWFGASIYTMYPLILAHANDHAAPGTHIQTSGGLLLLFGVGAIFGPLVAGYAMQAMGGKGLFATTVAAHIAIVLYCLWRISRRAPVAQGKKSTFVPAPNARSTTPQTQALAMDEPA